MSNATPTPMSKRLRLSTKSNTLDFSVLLSIQSLYSSSDSDCSSSESSDSSSESDSPSDESSAACSSVDSSSVVGAISGEDSGSANFEEITYEGYGPGGTAFIVQALTDNKNRTAAEVRSCFAKNGGNLAESGSVSWNFETKGVIDTTVFPEKIEEISLEIAKFHNAEIKIIKGEKLKKNFPTIYTVGRAAEKSPRLIDLHLTKDKKFPNITLVGKGVTFDSGGLDLKPAKAMELMKKDMGGAAIAMGLAHSLILENLDVNIRLIIPTVENAVSRKSMRPLDVIRTRSGIDVEIGNTDAEGRLILADALNYADEQNPDLLIDFATLTGAATVSYTHLTLPTILLV